MKIRINITITGRYPEYVIVAPKDTFVGYKERTVRVSVKQLARWRKAFKDFERAQNEMSKI